MIDLDTKEAVNSYMEALYSLANEENINLSKIKEDLSVFQELVNVVADGELSNLLCVSNKHLDSLVDSLFEHKKISELSYKFAKTINNNYHFFAIVEIIKNWDTFVLKQQGYKELELVTAVKLTESEFASLEQDIKSVIGNKIYIVHSVKPSIIGGLIVKYDNFLFDDSILSKLNNLESTMKGSI